MSLRDTIEAARREAEDNIEARSTKEIDEAEAKEAEREGDRPTFEYRASAATARPARKRAASVTMEHEGKKKNRLFPTREEREQEKAKEAAKEAKAAAKAPSSKAELQTDAMGAVLRMTPDFPKRRRIWLGLIIVGILAAIPSFILVFVVGGDKIKDLSSPGAIASIVCLVVAYIGLFGSIFYDRKYVRPLRDQAKKKVEAMNDRQLKEVIMKDAKLRAQKLAEKIGKSEDEVQAKK